MKSLFSIALAMALAGAAAAQSMDEFAYRADVTVSNASAPFHRAELPAELLRNVTRGDLADLRLFNAKGEAVPFAFANDAPLAAPVPTRTRLPLFAIGEEKVGATALPDVDVEIRRGADGSLVSLRASTQTPKAAPSAAPPAYYLLDASALKTPLTALRLAWSGQSGKSGGIATAQVEASDDLKNWRTVAGNAPLADLEQGGARLKTERIEFAGGKVEAKYLRLRIFGSAWSVSQVEAEAQGSAAPRESRSVKVNGSVAPRPDTTKPHEASFDLGGAHAVERVRLHLPQINSIVPIEFLARNSPDQAWASVSTTVAYRINQNNAEIVSPAIDVPRTRARYWLVRASVNSGGFGGEPALEAQYTPRFVVFIARGGETSYTLAYGKRARAGEKDLLQPATLNLGSLMPGFKEGDDWQLPVATVAAARTVNEKAVQKSVTDVVEPKQAGLWALLMLAVGVLGLFAWRLLKA